MTPAQWDTFRRAARGERLPAIPLALIIDSPWLPGYVGVSHHDFFLDPQVWFESHRRVHREFPDITFVPGWWLEYGMAAEPSALGAKVKFWPNNTPSVDHLMRAIEQVAELPAYDVEADAFMGLTLARLRRQRQQVLDTGEIFTLATARGPMCTAGFVRNTSDFMLDLVEKPELAHQLLDLATRLIIDWLRAQVKAMGPTVGGIFILDDIVGFVNEEFYREFCHPYLKRICDAFPADWVKLYHNDASIEACLEHLPDAGFNMLNWGKQTDIAEVKRRVGGRLCLLGNVNPLEVGVRGTPAQVREATLAVLEKSGGEGIVLSLGGGVSPGMPRENIVAMRDALAEFNRAHFGQP
jgi:uroporphyrinogen-III decarboxylase